MSTPSPAPLEGEDAGFTLLEMMISVALFAVFMAALIPTLFELQKPTLEVESLGSTQSQVNQAFMTLDREVRYAAVLNEPDDPSGATGNWFEEFESTYTGTGVCTQLRYANATGELDQRTWTISGSSYTGLSGWSVLATGLATGVNSPFTFYPATGIYIRQRLGIQLAGVSNVAGSSPTSSTSITFTAVDSSSSSYTNNWTASDPLAICTQVAES
jgi:prepilin-type N-terminal cleavage/methylation domain-containing protein